MKGLLPSLIISNLDILLRIFSSGPDKNVGGQAVIEGVMMRSPSRWAVVVRDPEGYMHIHREDLKRDSLFKRLPIVRGMILLWDSLRLGMKALKFSADVAIPENRDNGSSLWFGLSTIVAILIGIGVFLFLPLYITRIIGNQLPVVLSDGLLFNTVDGLVRVVFFLLYIFSIGLWSEMKKIYQYHGAEHKVINGFENDAPFDVSRMRAFSRFHPRCGTSFLLVVMVVSIVVFSFIPHSWPFYGKFLSRIVFIPLVAGLSYEFIKLSSKRWLRFLAIPGLVLQRLTTREPEDLQIEVAIKSLREVL